MDSRRWEEIQTTFDTLVELDVNERATRLATLASTDPELHRALESLLTADAEASAQLAPIESAFLLDAGMTIDPLGLAGRTVSHFEVRELLGAGGMGAVYRAEDTRLGRAAALKFLLPPHNLDAAAKARFLREAHSAAALDHPNLCTIHDVGTSEDGLLFLAMALYPGETLRERLSRDSSIPVREVLEIARQIAEGLDCAHAAGIVHRDLKPGNVMLLPDGSVKILDFGLAKMRDQSLSETGARFGTVSYMAPEQIRGEAVDGRADLWALGVVLYEMLTGRKPFGGEQDIAIAYAILHDEPVPPSMHRSDVPAAVEDLVLKLLHKDPARRYAAAGELPGELARVGTVPEGSNRWIRTRWLRVRRALGRNGQRMVAAGAALVVGTFGYAAFTRMTGDSVGDTVLAARRTAIAEGLPNDTAHLGKLADVQRRLGHWDEVFRILDRMTALSPRAPDASFIAGQTYQLLHRYAEAVRAYDRALTLAPNLRVAAIAKGFTYLTWQGQFDSMRSVLNRMPRDYAYGRLQLAYALYWQRKPDSLLQMLKETPLSSPGNPSLNLVFVGRAHQLRGDVSAARAAFESALLLLDSVTRVKPEYYATGLNQDYFWPAHVDRGFVLAALGRREEALREARWLQEFDAYDGDAFNGPNLHEGRALILAQLGDAEGALDEIEQLLEGPSWLSVNDLRLYPWWDPLREHPRFKALLAKYWRPAS